jgi:hypothetical protein
MSKESSFRAHLKRASRTVETWPEWKQRAIGGGPAAPRRASSRDTVKPGSTPKPSKRKD